MKTGTETQISTIGNDTAHDMGDGTFWIETEEQRCHASKFIGKVADGAFNLYTSINIAQTMEIARTCGSRSLALFLVLSVNFRMYGKSLHIVHGTFQSVAGLSKHDIYLAAKKLEAGGYIITEKKPGCKTKYALAKKGLEGIANIPTAKTEWKNYERKTRK